MKQKRIGQKINWWKWAFLLILAFNIAFIGVVVSRILQVREPEVGKISTTTSSDDIKAGSFSTNREQLNKTVAAYLQDFQTDKMSYTVYATSSTVVFEGTYTLLGYNVPLYLYFQPNRLENGAVQLAVTSLSVGTLPLPESQVLQYIKSSYDLPDFVEVLPESSAINVNIQDFNSFAGIYLKATTIDLVNDNFSFDFCSSKKQKAD